MTRPAHPLSQRKIFRTACRSLAHALAAVLLMVWATGPARAERIVLDWSEQIVNEAPAPEAPALLSDNALLILRNQPHAKIVDPESDPVNPLADSSRALVVQPGTGAGSANATIYLSPFRYQEAPKKGWVEMEVALADGGMIVIQLGAGSSDPTPSPEYDGTMLCTLFLRADDTTLVALGEGDDGSKRFFLSPLLLSIEPHKVRIAWDFGGDKPVITLQLDGEPLLWENEPAAVALDPAPGVDGMDRVNLSVYSGYLGKVTVSE